MKIICVLLSTLIIFSCSQSYRKLVYDYNGATDGSPRNLWREDYRCGSNHLGAHGRPGQCDPNGKFPCCSAAGWCGTTAEHCNCSSCVNYAGALGDGRVFEWNTVDFTGYVDNVMDRWRCCWKCHAHYRDTNMIQFFEQGKICSCVKTKPGIQPRYVPFPGYFSDTCVGVLGENELVSCGNQRAGSCASCPGSHGSSYCHGDCKWKGGRCIDDRKCSKYSGTNQDSVTNKYYLEEDRFRKLHGNLPHAPDEELEEIAKKITNKCIGDHSEFQKLKNEIFAVCGKYNIFGIGTNYSPGSKTTVQCGDLWKKSTGHYNQAFASKKGRVGCWAKDCGQWWHMHCVYCTA